jgi:hypothetical protein
LSIEFLSDKNKLLLQSFKWSERLPKSYISLNSAQNTSAVFSFLARHQPQTPLRDISDDRKSTRKCPKQLQFYERAGNLIKSVGLAVLITGVYVKSRIIVQNRGVR